MAAPDSDSTLSLTQLSSIPLDLLTSELARRRTTYPDTERPKCGSAQRSSYNTPIHVLALFLILFLSVFACAFPIIAKRFPSFPIPHRFLFISRHFGTGVLIATAFVHLFPTAYVSLTDPCLPKFWNETYPAFPGLIAMVSVFVVVGIEMFFATRGAGHLHGSEFDGFAHGGLDGHGHNEANGHAMKLQDQGNGSVGRYSDRERRPPDIALGDMPSSADNLMAGRSPLDGGPSPVNSAVPLFDSSNHPRGSHEDEDNESNLSLDLEELSPSRPAQPGFEDEADTSGLLNGRPSAKHQRSVSGANNPIPDLTDPAAHQRALLQCLLLEAGILFHSIFIGMALSVSVGPPFLVLLIAISFHQTFEGLALGSRISNLRFPAGSLKPWIMALAYGTTTPVGQAIGLAVHGLYDPASETGLLMVGIMNAISTGLLVFAGLVELLAEDFLSVESYKVLKGRRRIEACVAVVAGSMLMALVGAWA